MAGQQGNSVVVHHQSEWRGPLPSPDQLRRFDDVVPGAAERIIRMAEQEGEHTREVEMRITRATLATQRVGQVMAFAIAIMAMIIAYCLAMADHGAVASVLVGGTLAAIVGAFLGARRGRKAKS